MLNWINVIGGRCSMNIKENLSIKGSSSMTVSYPFSVLSLRQSSLTSWDARLITKRKTVDEQFCWFGIQILVGCHTKCVNVNQRFPCNCHNYALVFLWLTKNDNILVQRDILRRFFLFMISTTPMYILLYTNDALIYNKALTKSFNGHSLLLI